MSTIVDQNGQPFKVKELAEPQTARIAALQNQYLTPMLGGLTPQRLATILREGDNASLIEQHRMFADMEERDAHMRAEMDKRKLAVAGLPWSIVPPRNASAAEKKAADWATEMLTDAVSPMAGLMISLMDGVGHGFAPTEMEWRPEGKLRLPIFHARPQEWFTLDETRTDIRLRDSQPHGTPLTPFGWIVHRPTEAKTGYGARSGLFRTLAWPFLYKAYALGDYAEFLETYGLPFILGKYFDGASSEEKNSLHRAVTALGHDARAIMPAGMSIEIEAAAAQGGSDAHMAMVNWADKSQSKTILGQTLTADAGDKGSHALGKVHNEVRQDICELDALQLAVTLTRDLIYPMIAINLPGVDSLARCPRLVIDTSTPEDIKMYADALPKLVAVGFQVPRDWAQEKLHIPLPQEGEEVLATVKAPAPPPPGGQPTDTAALSGTLPAAPAPVAAPTAAAVEQLGRAAAPIWAGQVAALSALVANAPDLESLQTSLVNAYGGQPQEDLAKLMEAALALAHLAGMADVAGGN